MLPLICEFLCVFELQIIFFNVLFAIVKILKQSQIVENDKIITISNSHNGYTIKTEVAELFSRSQIEGILRL